LRIHIRASSQVLFDGFYITLEGSIPNWDVWHFGCWWFWFWSFGNWFNWSRFWCRSRLLRLPHPINTTAAIIVSTMRFMSPKDPLYW